MNCCIYCSVWSFMHRDGVLISKQYGWGSCMWLIFVALSVSVKSVQIFITENEQKADNFYFAFVTRDCLCLPFFIIAELLYVFFAHPFTSVRLFYRCAEIRNDNPDPLRGETTIDRDWRRLRPFRFRSMDWAWAIICIGEIVSAPVSGEEYTSSRWFIICYNPKFVS